MAIRPRRRFAALAALAVVVTVAGHTGLVAGVYMIAVVLVGAVLTEDLELPWWRAPTKEMP